MTILLKKRMFSSPAAFAHTVGVYLETLENRRGGSAPNDDVPGWLDEFHDYVATYDDEALAEAEDDAVSRAVPLQSEAEPDDGAEAESRC